jgi:hypothetical protein
MISKYLTALDNFTNNFSNGELTLIAIGISLPVSWLFAGFLHLIGVQL